MAPKKSSLKSLPKKGVNAKKASSVKGGRMKLDPLGKDKLAANHNQVARKLKPLPKKAVTAKKAEAVKGGKRKDKLAGNHNLTVR